MIVKAKNISKLRFIYFTFLFLISQAILSQNTSKEIDSIVKYRILAGSDSLSLEKKIYYSKKAIKLSNQTNLDSTILESNRVLSFLFIRKSKDIY